ncbi:MAG: hypothetical protein MMC23_000683 [Stictis urceolatum]|nr:hypothetical protein [Stictis urceolata]
MPPSQEQIRLLDLPAEIRELIYHEILDARKNVVDYEHDYKAYKFDLSIFRVNQQIYHEARRVFRRNNIFVAIESPWTQAEEHAAMEGQVPVLVPSHKSAKFTDYYMKVVVDAQYYAAMMAEARFKFIVLIDDLPRFTRMWYYQDLTHRGLNNHLRLTLQLKYPYASDYDDKPIPKAIQKQLMEPFGMIKGLQDVRIEGEHYASIKKAMQDAMDAPYKSPEDCLDDCTRFKDDGNAAFAKQLYREAILLYVEAFRAIHIICNGRRRAIWGDAFFQKDLVGGRYDRQEGLIVRLRLRTMLVANVVECHLKLHEYDDAKFWGMRTITMMRDALDNEDFMPGFVAAAPMGKIYYRTALAYRELGDKDEARPLLRVAEQYLPNDQNVKNAIASVALRLG